MTRCAPILAPMVPLVITLSAAAHVGGGFHPSGGFGGAPHFSPPAGGGFHPSPSFHSPSPSPAPSRPGFQPGGTAGRPSPVPSPHPGGFSPNPLTPNEPNRSIGLSNHSAFDNRGVGNQGGSGNRNNSWENRTNLSNRGNNDNLANRGNVNSANRTATNNSANVNRGNINSGNRANVNVQGNTVNFNNSIYANRYNTYGWRNGYYNGYHPWVNGYWGWNRGYPWAWGATGFALGVGVGWMSAPVEVVGAYYNPYYVAPPSPTYITYNYSQPLPAPPAAEQASTANYYDQATPTVLPYSAPSSPPDPQPASQRDKPPANDEALKTFDAARAAFKRGDYAKAEELANKAIQSLPSDATFHEFLGLTLFAEKKYREAAATVYAVVSAGPGWNWETVKSLYPDTQTYTKQLRALEEYQRANPKDSAASFLLAYHYLVIGSPDAAVKQLENVVALEPKDNLAQAMLKSMKKPSDEGAPTPGG